MNCPVCGTYHYPEKDEIEKLCDKHLFQLYLATLIAGNKELQIFIDKLNGD